MCLLEYVSCVGTCISMLFFGPQMFWSSSSGCSHVSLQWRYTLSLLTVRINVTCISTLLFQLLLLYISPHKFSSGYSHTSLQWGYTVSHCNKYVTCISTLIFSSIAVFLLVSLLPLDILFWLLTRILSMGSHCLSRLKRVIHTCCPPASVTRAYRPSSYFSFYCFISLSRSSSSWQSLLATHTLSFNGVTLTISS